MRTDLPKLPGKMRRLPRDSAGRPVPFFASWIDGKPDFRVMDAEKLVRCHRGKLCWVCGAPLLKSRMSGAAYGTFAVGPMCVVNRVSAEPPSHDECADWSARACPFLTNADKGRRTTNLPEGVENPAGIMIERNPGAIALVEARRWNLVPNIDGMLFRFVPEQVRWMAEGRTARMHEILESIETGLPILMDMIKDDEEEAWQELAFMTNRALRYVPSDDVLDNRPLERESLDGYPNLAKALRL